MKTTQEIVQNTIQRKRSSSVTKPGNTSKGFVLAYYKCTNMTESNETAEFASLILGWNISREQKIWQPCDILQKTNVFHLLAHITGTCFHSIYAHALNVNINPVPHINSAFSVVPSPFGTAQAIFLRLAQLEAQLVLNLMSNITAGNHSSFGNPFALLCLLQAAATQRSSYLTMHQPPNLVSLSHLLHRRNANNITHMVNPPSSNGTVMSSVTEISSVVTSQDNFQAKEVIQKRTTGLGLSSNTTVLEPTSIFSKSTNATPPKGQVLVTLDSTTLGEKDPQQQATLQTPSENLTKALTTLGLSLEDLDLISHCPEDLLTKEMLPFIIQDMQKHKEAKDLTHTTPESIKKMVIEYGHASMLSSDHPHVSLNTNGKHHSQGNQKFRHCKLQEDNHQSISSSNTHLHSPYRRLDDSYSHGSIRSEKLNTSELIHKKRDLSGKRSKLFAKRLQHGIPEGSRQRSSSVYISSRSMGHSFISPCHNTNRNNVIQMTSSHSRSVTPNVVGKHHNELSFSSVTSERTTKLKNTENAKTSSQTRGVIRLSRIPLDFSERELIKMAAPFGQPGEVLKATEIDMITSLEWKKALVMFPAEVSAQEMVKVYCAIPPHMREQSLELVSQTVDPTSPVSVFHAFVGPSTLNGLLTPADHLLVVCNVPHQPSAATGVLRLLKPFGKVFRTLVFRENKVDVDHCTGNNSSIQMVLEMESAAVALSVYEWSQTIPCIYHNHHLSFLRGSNLKKNTSESPQSA